MWDSGENAILMEPIFHMVVLSYMAHNAHDCRYEMNSKVVLY